MLLSNVSHNKHVFQPSERNGLWRMNNALWRMLFTNQAFFMIVYPTISVHKINSYFDVKNIGRNLTKSATLVLWVLKSNLRKSFVFVFYRYLLGISMTNESKCSHICYFYAKCFATLRWLKIYKLIYKLWYL